MLKRGEKGAVAEDGEEPKAEPEAKKTYVPNAGQGLVRLEYRHRWDEAFHKFLKGLASRKPLVLCVDLSVAHEKIDL
ncbi:DNA- lyase [Camelus dromedarius]|uniref:DNA-lyase n=1 Tax=Camelus dromedarius TaxID=9838 RepID=A0A5N4DF80_CAMDR|nr:DNA- lyase [Camelus dromedarius]